MGTDPENKMQKANKHITPRKVMKLVQEERKKMNLFRYEN